MGQDSSTTAPCSVGQVQVRSSSGTLPVPGSARDSSRTGGRQGANGKGTRHQRVGESSNSGAGARGEKK